MIVDYETWVDMGPRNTVVFIYTAPWCGPCRQLKQTLKEFDDERPDDYVFVIVDAEEEPEACRHIRGVPFLEYEKEGEIKSTRDKISSKFELKRWLEGVEE